MEDPGIVIYDYDLDKYNFPALVSEMLGVEDLSKLHLESGAEFEVFTRETDQKTHFHQKFYEQPPEFVDLYERFVAEFIRPLIGEAICYQAIPTFRTHFPENVAVGEFHNDGKYNHPIGELNFWLPLTKAWGSNSVMIEEDIGGENYRAIEIEPGQVLHFDAVRRNHGNILNETGSTRVSFDFRVQKMSEYKPSEATTVNTGTPLAIGGYFKLLEE